MSDAPQLLAADKLCLLTGLTDRRHRQLAAEGYFPPPKESQYLLTPTIQGMFRYYRESSRREKGELNEEKLKKTKLESELLAERLAREKRQLVERTEVNKLLLHISTRGRTMLYQFFETEAPPKLDGLGAAAQRPILREMADSIADAMADLVSEFEKQ